VPRFGTTAGSRQLLVAFPAGARFARLIKVLRPILRNAFLHIPKIHLACPDLRREVILNDVLLLEVRFLSATPFGPHCGQMFSSVSAPPISSETR